VFDKPVIEEYLKKVDDPLPFYIDIGCSTNSSITSSRAERSDTTVFFERGIDKAGKYAAREWARLPQFRIITKSVSPSNIGDLLRTCTDRTDPTFVDLDIDGYDYFILEALLREYTPALICCEINEKIPPPIKFTVKYNPKYHWDVSHFYGMSITKLEELLTKYGYNIINLTLNNVYAAASTCKALAEEPIYTAKEAYEKFYVNDDRRTGVFRHNKDMEPLLHCTPEEGIKFLKEKFAGKRSGPAGAELPEYEYELGL